MAAEIERKFLLQEEPPWLGEHPSVAIEQGYLAIGEDSEVRLRKLDRERLLTVKRGSGRVREEVEVDIGGEQFDRLWPLSEGRRVAKRRHRVDDGGVTAEVDVYSGGLEGLVTGEVEFPSEAASEEFEPPGWLGREITGDARYANENLAKFGLPGQAR